MASTNTDIWKISAEERAKHNAQFNQLNPVNGYVSGEQAREFFLKSGLPAPTLGQIWNLADLTKDGKLDKKEFSIACFLIKKVLLGVSLPLNLPASILVEPPMAVIDTKATASTTTLIPNLFSQSTTSLSSVQSLPNSFPASSFSSLSLTSTTTPTPPLVAQMSAPSSALLTHSLQSNAFASLPAFPATMPPLASTMPISASPPMVTTTPPNTIPPIPTTSRNKYLQVFQSNDHTSCGFLNGTQAKTLLVQTGLPQQQLAHIWTLSDFDNDGKLSLEEFILAMHLCDYAKTGSILPSTLPVDLQPKKSRASSMNLTSSPLDSLMPLGNLGSPPPAANQNDQSASPKIARSFEDKRKENFDKGNAVLEAKRQMLREQAEREKREREEKERLEQEKKFKLKEEQERKRLAEIEKQLEKQRMMDAQREEERKKAIEQRETARQELLRQQRIEWERQRKTELENQKLKLQEHLSTLKAKDKNLEYDMQLLNDKITSSKTKISDTQSTLSELNIQMDSIKKNLERKTNECEIVEKQVKEFNENLKKLSQEKLIINEKLKHMNQDNPFAESYRNESVQYKQEQMYIQQLRENSEKMDSEINNLRTQIECLKHTVEASKNEIIEINKENDRINSLVNLKRNDFKIKYTNNPLVAQINQILSSSPSTPSSATTTPTNANTSITNQFRSNTPKDNYDAFKEEISKIQVPTMTTSSSNIINADLNSIGSINTTANLTPITNSNAVVAATSNTDVTSNPQSTITSPTNDKQQQKTDINWSNAFDGFSQQQPQPQTFDPFNSENDPFKAFGGDNDPFANFNSPNNNANTDNTDPWSNFGNNNSTTNGNTFDDAFSAFANNNNNADAFKNNDTKEHQNNVNDPSWDLNNQSSKNHNNSSNLNESNNNWALFEDAFNNSSTKPATNSTVQNKVVKSTSNNSISSESKSNVTSPTQQANVKNIVDKFNAQKVAIQPAPVQPQIPAHQHHHSQPQKQSLPQSNAANLVKYRVLFNFEGQRDDELTLQEGEIVTIDYSVKADEGWSFGTCKGRSGVFPTAFAAPLSELEAIQEEQLPNAAHHPIHETSNMHHVNGNGLSYNQASGFNGRVQPQPQVQIQPQVQTHAFAPAVETKQNHGLQVITIAPYTGKKDNHLSFNAGEIIDVREQRVDWWSGELNGKIGWFPESYVKLLDKETNGLHANEIPKNNDSRNLYISLFPFESNEPGDLNFGQYEIINVIEKNGEWFTGQIDDPAHDKQLNGIFPSNYVRKFDFPIEYTQKFNIAIALQDYIGQTNEELSLRVSDFVAITQVSPDNQWSYGELYDDLHQVRRGWFPTHNVDTIIVSTNNSATTTAFSSHNTINANTNSTAVATTTIISATSTTSYTNAGSFAANTSSSTNNNNNNINNIFNEILSSTTTTTTTTIISPTIPSTTNITSLNNVSNQAEEVIAQQATPNYIDQVIALYDFQSTTPGTISFPKDAIINITAKNSDWWNGEYNGQSGLLPFNYVQSIDVNSYQHYQKGSQK